MGRRFLLILLIAGELAAGGWLLAARLRRPPPPAINISRLPPATAAAFEGLRQRADLDRAGDWLELGEACLGYGYLPEAEVCLARAVALAPEDSQARWAYARSLERLGRLDAAITAFEETARRSDYGRELQCRVEIGKCHLRAERAQDAERAFSVADKFPQARLELTRLSLATGRLDKAAAYLAELQKSPRMEIETEMLAVELGRLRGDPLATAIAEERSERSSGEAESRREWLDLEQIRGRYGLQAEIERINLAASPQTPAPERVTAAARYQQFLEANPLEVTEPFLVAAMRIAAQAHDADAALRWIDLFEKRVSIPPFAQHYAGQACFEAKKMDQARALFAEANRRSPIEESTTRLAELEEAANNTAEAKRLRAQAAWLLGIETYLGGDLEGAHSSLTTATTLLPDDPRPWFTLGEVALAGGDLNRAAAAYREALKRNPRSGRARERLQAVAPEVIGK